MADNYDAWGARRHPRRGGGAGDDNGEQPGHRSGIGVSAIINFAQFIAVLRAWIGHGIISAVRAGGIGRDSFGVHLVQDEVDVWCREVGAEADASA